MFKNNNNTIHLIRPHQSHKKHENFTIQYKQSPHHKISTHCPTPSPLSPSLPRSPSHSHSLGQGRSHSPPWRLTIHTPLCVHNTLPRAVVYDCPVGRWDGTREMGEGDHWTKGSKNCFVIYAYQTREERETGIVLIWWQTGRTSENKMGVRRSGGVGGGMSVVETKKNFSNKNFSNVPPTEWRIEKRCGNTWCRGRLHHRITPSTLALKCQFSFFGLTFKFCKSRLWNINYDCVAQEQKKVKY